MDAAAFGARFIVALVLVIAGLRKVASPSASRTMLVDFRIPASIIPALTLILPWSELAIGLSLIPWGSAWWGAIGAACLLSAIAAVTAGNLVLGRRPRCQCFGMSNTQISWWTVARTLGLLILSMYVVSRGLQGVGAIPPALKEALTTNLTVGVAIDVGIFILLSIVAWLLVEVLRQQGRILLRLRNIEGGAAAPINPPLTAIPASPSGSLLPIGSKLPDIVLHDLQGNHVSLYSLIPTNKSMMILFVHPGCGACSTVLHEAPTWQRQYDNAVSLVVVSAGRAANLWDQDAYPVLLHDATDVTDAFGVTATPSALVVSQAGNIASRLALGPDDIRALLMQTASSTSLTADRHQVARTIDAPAFRLPNLSGDLVNSSQFTGMRVLLLFWDPRCGHCRQMVSELQMIDAS